VVGATHEAMAAQFHSVSAGRRFVPDTVRCSDVAAVGDSMATLNCFPCRMLRFPEFLFLTRVPPDCGGIKNNLRSMQGSQPRRFRVPLVPANTDTDVAALGLPRLKPEIARCEIEFLVIERIIGNMHFPIFAQQFAVRVNDCCGVMVQSVAATLEEGRNT